MNINVNSTQADSALALLPMYVPGALTSVQPAGVAHLGVPLAIYPAPTGLAMVIDPVTTLSTTLAAFDTVVAWLNGQPTSAIKIIQPGEENDRILLYLPPGLLVNGINTLFYRVTRISSNFEDSTPILNVLFNNPAPNITVSHPASIGPGQPAVITLTVGYARPYDTVTLTIGTWSITFNNPDPAQPITHTLSAAELRQIGDGTHPVNARVIDQLTNSGVSPTTFIDIRARDLPTGVISTRSNPYGIGISPDGEHAYVCVQGGIEVIDTANLQIISFIPIPEMIITGFDVVFNPVLPLAYITNPSGGVPVIDTKTFQRLGTIQIPKGPSSIVLNKDGTLGFVSTWESKSLVVFNAVNFQIVKTIATGSWAGRIAISTSGDHVYVANDGPPDLWVSIIDTKSLTIVGTVRTTFRPYGVVAAPDGESFYVFGPTGSPGPGAIAQYDASNFALIRTITDPGSPVRITSDRSGAALYYLDYRNSNFLLSALDTVSGDVIGSVALEPYNSFIVISADGSRAFVPCRDPKVQVVRLPGIGDAGVPGLQAGTVNHVNLQFAIPLPGAAGYDFE